MDIFHPDKHTFSLIKDFVKPYEEKCVLLCSYIRKEDEKVFVIKDNENIIGVLYIDSTLFHYVPEENQLIIKKNADIFMKSIKNILGNKKIHCISGDASGTDLFINLLKIDGQEPFQINNYSLMTLGNMLPNLKPAPLCNDDHVVRFTSNNINDLFPLQIKYLQEEVAPKGKIVSDLEAKISLRQILKNQLCLAMISDDEIVAKANTNAIGINWVQIGGVYTHPLYRRNGYAFQLVYRICVRALKVNKKVALFVKEKNQAAIELYKRLGFSEKSKYKISYFK